MSKASKANRADKIGKMLKDLRLSLPSIQQAAAVDPVLTSGVTALCDTVLALEEGYHQQQALAIEERRRGDLLQDRLKRMVELFNTYSEAAEKSIDLNHGTDNLEHLITMDAQKEAVKDMQIQPVSISVFTNPHLYAAIGSKVVKQTALPFKSTLRTNTVKGYCFHPITARPCYLFEEDDSHVETRMCEAAPQEPAGTFAGVPAEQVAE
jgi:hypothetical protein